MIVYGLNIDEFEYAYRVDGPYCPEKGLLFDKNKILLDPYAKAVAGQRTWGIRWDHTYHARVVKDRFDWGDMPQSKKELCDLIIYELHVRDFTHHPSSGVQHRGTFSGLMEKIPYLKELGIRVKYLHADIDTLERQRIIRDMRLDAFDVLVGINLLREGLDIPEISLVAILDADKEGFLRTETSLVQTIGRAARNSEGHVIMYADKITESMEKGNRGKQSAAERFSRHIMKNTGLRRRQIRKSSA